MASKLTSFNLPRSLNIEIPVFAVLVLLGVGGRVLPHPPNFTPIAAAALFSGFLFRSRPVAAAVPFLTMLLSDVFFLGMYDLRIQAMVYAALVCPVLMRTILRRGRMFFRVGACSLAMSTLFFLVSNFAVWAFSGIYAPTAKGLWSCYIAALPFYQNTLAGDLFWSTVIFGAYALISRRSLASSPVALGNLSPAAWP